MNFNHFNHQKFTLVPIGKCECAGCENEAVISLKKGVSPDVWSKPTKMCEKHFAEDMSFDKIKK